MTYELHPLCTLFPRLSGAEFSALRDDIKANGLRQPIVLHGGMILDGGNRYRACIEAGIEPTFAVFDGGNLVSFVLSANLHRRHMSAGQQAAIVASAQDWAKAQPQGRNTITGNVAGDTVADRVAQSGASDRTQRMADKVAKADPELAREVAHGNVSLPKALKQVEAKEPQLKPVKAKTAAEQEREQAAEDAFGGTSAVELLEEMQQEVEKLTAEIKAAEADDLKAEAMKWRRAYEHACRQQSEAMDKAHREIKRHESTYRKLIRCGKAVGEADPDQIAAAVEAFVRQNRRAA